jgi:hypothetical protein
MVVVLTQLLRLGQQCLNYLLRHCGVVVKLDVVSDLSEVDMALLVSSTGTVMRAASVVRFASRGYPPMASATALGK